MAPVLWAAVLALAFAPQVVESPHRILLCNHEEYSDPGGHCCKKCPAGTYVAQSCIKPHTSGICASCHKGIDYTDRANGLDECFFCADCKSGFEMVKSCTVESNTVCQCKTGYYCPPSCEECVRCKTKCPEGQIPVQECSATTDMECGSPKETMDALSLSIIIPVVVFVFVVVMVLLCWRYIRDIFSHRDEENDAKSSLFKNENESKLLEKRERRLLEHFRKKNPAPNGPTSDPLLECQIETRGPVLENELLENADRKDLAAGNTNEEPPLGSTASPPPVQVLPESLAPSSIAPSLNSKESKQQPVVVVVARNPDSLKELDEIYFESRKKVPGHNWKNLMRKSGLEDNDIDEIVRDHPSETDEQHYQMLKTLQNRYGNKDALLKLLNGMWAMKLRYIYENLTNELRSRDIITLETKD